MSGAGVYLIGVLALLAVDVHGLCNQFKCPESSGFYGHPQTCLSYVKCLDGEAFVEQCPANLHYNAASGSCDNPQHSQCIEDSKSASTSCSLGPRVTQQTPAISGFICDCGKCCRKPNPQHCNKFFECDENGNAYSKSCGEGLVYNPEKEECDLPSNFECEDKTLCKCKCRYPVNDECSAYYMCDEIGGVVIKDYCTEGLVFNPQSEQCDLPDRVDCPAAPPPTTLPGECKDLQNDCKFWAANGDCVCDPFKNGDCSWQSYVKNNCPSSCSGEKCDGTIVTARPTKPGIIDGCVIDCTHGQYHRHPTDCTKFIECTSYGPQDMPCAPGTRWDQDILTCNHESVTKCVTGTYVNEEGQVCSGSSENGPNQSSSSESEEDSSSESDENNNSESSENNGSGTGENIDNGNGSGIIDGCVIECTLGKYYRHPTDCTKFIQCAPYGPAEMSCAEGTRWDQSILTCGHESQTICVTGTYSTENGRPCGGTENSADGDCIDCSTGQQYFRHPTDCTMFIQCTSYGPQEMPCGTNTRWDQNILTCNHADVTPCVTGNGECTNNVVTKPSDTDTCSFDCPKVNGEFAHPTNCRKWIHCSNNIPYIKDCPDKLHFDPVKKVCNWPEETICISNLESDSCIIPIPIIPTLPEVTPPDVCDCDCCLRPHPEDCQSYYYCDGANTEFHSCSDGLVFYPANETCVYAADYPECQIISTPDCKDCECQFPSEICSEYFKCVDDKPIKEECPKDLLYNPDLHACDFPENVDCVSKPTRRLLAHGPRAISAPHCKTLPDGRYASAMDKSSFFHCANGIAFKLGCQYGAQFDFLSKKCTK